MLSYFGSPNRRLCRSLARSLSLTELQRLAVGGDLRRIEKILSDSKVVSG